MKLSIIIPVFNERGTINQIINIVDQMEMDKEIIVVDDGSSDGTRDVLSQINLPSVKKLFHQRNMGKGAAIRTGLSAVSGDIVIIQDADLEYDPQDYYSLIQPILDGKADVVYGSRFLGGIKGLGGWKIIYIHFTFGVILLNFLVYLLYGQRITDEATCYKVFKADVIKSLNLRCQRFEFCPEVTAKLLKKGYKIYELPISYQRRTFEEGKKIGWRDGVTAIWTLLKYRFID